MLGSIITFLGALLEGRNEPEELITNSSFRFSPLSLFSSKSAKKRPKLIDLRLGSSGMKAAHSSERQSNKISQTAMSFMVNKKNGMVAVEKDRK